MARIPISTEVGVRTFFCGPESFTPDLAPIVGEAPELRNYFVAAGLNSIGILTGGGIGRALAHWIVDGRPDIDVTGMQHRPAAARTSATRSTGRPARSSRSAWSTRRHYPGKSMQHRPRRQAVAAARAAGARSAPTSATSAAGRGPTGTRPRASEPEVGELSWGRQNWFGYWAAEHRAAREGVILMDMSFMSKFLVQGRDAGAALERVSRQPGRRRAGRDHLHPVAQRGRHARGRPHRDQAGRRPVLGGRLRHRAPARRDPDAPRTSSDGARVRHRRDRRRTPRSTSRGRARASCWRR